MLLTVRTTHRPASELGYLLHKNPTRVQSFDLSFGRAAVFYPEVTDEACTAALLLDVDSVGLVRGRSREDTGSEVTRVRAGPGYQPAASQRGTRRSRPAPVRMP